MRVPETWWAPAVLWQVDGFTAEPPAALGAGPWIIRSASVAEDGAESTLAGQLLSLVVEDRSAFGEVARRVAARVREFEGTDGAGRVFVQRFLVTEEAGVAFTDGWWLQRSAVAGDNRALTDGTARGEVVRGHLERDDSFSSWIASVAHAFSELGTIDVEYTRDDQGYLLLQVRPAPFDLPRNRTLSLANHKEILGEVPSRLMGSVLEAAGQDVVSWFARVDPEIASWKEPYAVLVGERPWMNFSVFFRMMDRWGLPRAFVTEGVGGQVRCAEDARVLPGRLLRAIPRLVKLQIWSLVTLLRSDRELRRLDDRIAAAHGPAELFAVSVEALALAIRTNFGIGGLYSGALRTRRMLRIRGTAPVVTLDMMEAFAAIGARPRAEREQLLADWIARYGHRGPLESDLARPRFAELEELLRNDLLAAPEASDVASGPGRRPGWLTRPFYWVDVRRERFRDEVMRRWQVLRARWLAEGEDLVRIGHLDRPEDVFGLRGETFSDPRADLRARLAEGQARQEALRGPGWPETADQESLILRESGGGTEDGESCDTLRGIAIGPQDFEGTVLKADDLTALLATRAGELTGETVLVVEALEPSWCVVFPRVGAVVTEIGGEMSHASILLREAGKPAIVNVAGVRAALADGDRVRGDARTGIVERIETAAHP